MVETSSKCIQTTSTLDRCRNISTTTLDSTPDVRQLSWEPMECHKCIPGTRDMVMDPSPQNGQWAHLIYWTTGTSRGSSWIGRTRFVRTLNTPLLGRRSSGTGRQTIKP